MPWAMSAAAVLPLKWPSTPLPVICGRYTSCWLASAPKAVAMAPASPCRRCWSPASQNLGTRRASPRKTMSMAAMAKGGL